MNSRSRTRFVSIMWLVWTAVCGAVLSLAGVFLYLNPQIPTAETYRHVRIETPLRIFAEGGQLMAEFGERRVIPLKFADVPPLFVHALLDTEDKRFYSHGGVDFVSLLNDSIELVLNREIKSGASTITMQLAKNISFSPEQTFIRKFKEMLLALKIERELTKDEILELYFNVVPFGKRAYGAQAAAFTYYGRPLNQLDVAQLAMLAGIPQAPSAGNPINGPERAMRRRNLVLSRMLEQDSITQAQYDVAVNSPNTATVHERDLDIAAPYASEWVRQQLVARYGAEVYSSGYEALTTVDAHLQNVATKAVRDGVFLYDRRHGYRGPVAHLELPGDADAMRIAIQQELVPFPPHVGLEAGVVVSVAPDQFAAMRANGETVTIPIALFKWARRFIDANSKGEPPAKASDVVATGDVVWLKHVQEGWALSQMPDIQSTLVAMNPNNGAIKAIVGGFDFSANQFNHALQASRQPGSGFKPFVYSAALNAGITPASIFMDAPLVFEDDNLEAAYRPKNDGGRYNGPTRLREALYRSINLVSIRVLMQVGAGDVLEYVKRFGFDTSEFPRNTQLAIGGGTMGVTPLQMARAYATFANGGYLVEPNIVKEVKNMAGEVIYKANYPVVCRDCPPPAPTPITNENGAAAPTDAVASDAPIPAPRVIDEGNAFIMNSMLQDVIKRGTAIRARSLNRNDIAGKTGTTNEADTWFNGYQKNLVASVWVGFSDHRPVGDNEYGSNSPLPIWMDFMKVALDGVPEEVRQQPPGVVTLKIDPRSGEPALPDDQNAIFEYFLAGHTPPGRRSTQMSKDGDSKEAVEPIDIF
jgi:penicillin-binding protein 1A